MSALVQSHPEWCVAASAAMCQKPTLHTRYEMKEAVNEVGSFEHQPYLILARAKTFNKIRQMPGVGGIREACNGHKGPNGVATSPPA